MRFNRHSAPICERTGSITSGIDAIGKVTTKLEPTHEIDFDQPDARRMLQRTDSGANFDEFKNPQTGSITARTFTGHGADTDILVASAKSYLSALNRILDHRVRQANIKQGGDGRVAA